MKKLSLIQIILTILGTLLLLLFKNQYDALSFFVGGLVIGLSFLSWGLAMGFIFQKKFVALSIGIIVFKYAILGVIIYHFVKQSWMQPFWLSAGVATMMFGSLTYGLTLGFFEDRSVDNEEFVEKKE